MEQRKCLIAGLPESGKSTYLGALWNTINFHKDKERMRLKAAPNNPPENVEQLMALSTRWVNVEDMDRTSSDVPDSISFNLTNGMEEFALKVPDFRGESIRQIVTRNQPKSFDEWIETGETLLYMINNVDSGVFADDCREDEMEQAEDSDDIPVFDVKRMTPVALNMLILRYFSEKCQFRKVVICLTAWDEVIDNCGKINPTTYLKEQAPALYNFIEYHFSNVAYFGLSAQGAKYEYESSDQEGNGKKKVTAECKRRLQEKTKNGTRAFVVADMDEDFDITRPIAALFE